MKTAKLWLAKLILRAVCWYFVGREVTRVRIDETGTLRHESGKVIGRRIEFPEGVLLWVPSPGDFSDVYELSPRDLIAVKGS